MDIVNRNTLRTLSRPLLISGGKLGLAVVLALSLTSCVYVPVVDEPDASASCKTYTKTMSLNTIEMSEKINIGAGGDCGRNDCAALALAGVIVVTAGSAIISGSIVLTGNTIHWLEYQGTCSDGYLSKAKKLFLDTIGKSKPAEAEGVKQK